MQLAVLLRRVHRAERVRIAEVAGLQAVHPGAVEQGRDPRPAGCEQLRRPRQQTRLVGRSQGLVVPSGHDHGRVVSGQRVEQAGHDLRVQQGLPFLLFFLATYLTGLWITRRNVAPAVRKRS